MNTGRSGRGPTRLMSPCSTLMNCGNSSRLVLRRKVPKRGAARVVLPRPDRAGLRLGIDAHAAELEHLERLAVQAAALLAIEDRAGAGQLDQHGDQQHQRAEHDQGDQRQDDVHDPLDDDVEAEVRAFAQADHRHAVEVRRGQRQAGQVGHVGDQADLDQAARQDVEDRRASS